MQAGPPVDLPCSTQQPPPRSCGIATAEGDFNEEKEGRSKRVTAWDTHRQICAGRAGTDHTSDCRLFGGGGGGVRGRDALEGVEVPPPLQGAQPMPSHCPPDAKCRLQWHLQPTVTAPNRFGSRLQPPIFPLLRPPLRTLPFYCIPGVRGSTKRHHGPSCPGQNWLQPLLAAKTGPLARDRMATDSGEDARGKSCILDLPPPQAGGCPRQCRCPH